MTFNGYQRPDGRVGSRNLVGVIPTVVCANDVAQAVVRQVQGCAGFYHHQGCCQLPPDLDRVTETLISLGKSPNLGAVLLVSLGCEGTDTDRLYREIQSTGKPVEIIRIQELGGTSKAISAGTDAAQKLALEISGRQRVPCELSEVVMAIKCGGSDATSGMASNCVIGYVADKMADLGATVVFGETTEFIGAEHILAKRAIDENVAEDIFRIVREMEHRAESLGCDMRK
ncbi:MAG: UxaA family hydrolase, partial [Eubacteriales bacterium]|nr:UxaA family hydrolase [Eubacteriales bacterium]